MCVLTVQISLFNAVRISLNRDQDARWNRKYLMTVTCYLLYYTMHIMCTIYPSNKNLYLFTGKIILLYIVNKLLVLKLYQLSSVDTAAILKF